MIPSVDARSVAPGAAGTPSDVAAVATGTTPTVPGRRPDARLVAAVATGTTLNPINSSMIAVALVPIAAAFGAGTSTSTWLISGFFLAAAVGMPLMGRIADLFGPKRTFVSGLVLVGVSSAVAVVAPTFAVLVLCRVGMAFGTSTAYPSGLAIFRARDPHGTAPAGALAILGIASSVVAALGPVLGGILVGTTGWQGIFLINVPAVAIGLVIALRWLPPDPPAPVGARVRSLGDVRSLLDTVDAIGVVLFAVLIVGLLAFVLTLPTGPQPLLLGAAIVSGALFVMRELAAATPFVDLRLLARNRALIWIYAQFAGVNLVFYGVFFGLPIWLEEVRGFSAAAAGPLLLPLAGIGILATPFAARIVSRRGPGPAIVIGSVALLAGTILLLGFNDSTPVIVIVAAGAVLGIPTAFNNLGLQAGLYEATPAGLMGTASGQFQTFRYVGAIAASAIIGIGFSPVPTSAGLDELAVVFVAVSAALVVASIAGARLTRRRATVVETIAGDAPQAADGGAALPAAEEAGAHETA